LILTDSQKISEAERVRRQKGINYVRGTLRLEGLIMDDDDEALFARYIAGEINLRELTTGLNQLNGVKR